MCLHKVRPRYIKGFNAKQQQKGFINVLKVNWHTLQWNGKLYNEGFSSLVWRFAWSSWSQVFHRSRGLGIRPLHECPRDSLGSKLSHLRSELHGASIQWKFTLTLTKLLNQVEICNPLRGLLKRTQIYLNISILLHIKNPKMSYFNSKWKGIFLYWCTLHLAIIHFLRYFLKNRHTIGHHNPSPPI